MLISFIRMTKQLLPRFLFMLGIATLVPPRSMAADKPDATPGFTFDCGQAQYNEAYQKARRVIQADIRDGKFMAGKQWAQVWTRDSSYSTDLSLNLLQPALCQSTLLGIKEDVADFGECWAQDKCGHFAGWPNLTDAIVGATGAWSLYLVTGDEPSLKVFYKRTVNSLKRAEKDAQQADTGLFAGCSSFMESDSAYPAKYANHGEMLAKTVALSTTALYYQGYIVAGKMADKLGDNGQPYRVKAKALKKAINKYFWQEDKGYYGYFLDENKKLIPAMEGLGEALCIQFGIAEPQQARRILRSTPTTPFGFPCLWPQWPEYMNYHTGDAMYHHNGMIWPFVQGYWARSAAQLGDVATFQTELEKLVKLSRKNDTFQEFYHPEDAQPDGSPDQLWSASGYLSMILHGLLGISFEEKGIRFKPVVPAQFSQITLQEMQYRQSVLNLNVIGHGTRVAGFKLDGNPSNKAFFDASLSGQHRIEIQMQ